MTEGRAEIEILGQRITVRGRGSAEYIQGLADYLNGKIRAVREQGNVHDPTRLSVLAGLHVADELFQTREQEATLAARVDHLVGRLTRALADG
jgi:cell division protein ZapA (FtsZ GTPase activity inhibitor)